MTSPLVSQEVLYSDLRLTTDMLNYWTNRLLPPHAVRGKVSFLLWFCLLFSSSFFLFFFHLPVAQDKVWLPYGLFQSPDRWLLLPPANAPPPEASAFSDEAQLAELSKIMARSVQH